jgi:acyl-CoA synthetase (AMP-forming)/AMP-acid ligase II
MINNWLFDKFLSLPERIAIIYREKKYSYKELIEKINQLTDNIHISEIQQGEVVAIISDYSFHSIALFFALLKNQNIIVPIISTAQAEIEKRLDIARVRISFVLEGESVKILKRNQVIQHPLETTLIEKNHAGLILFSSGITGESKGMVHDLDVLINSYKKASIKDINSLLFLTFDHIGGIDSMLRILSGGGTITLPVERDPFYICKIIEQHRVNVLPCSPTFLNMLIISEAYKAADLSSLEIIGYGAEPMPEYLLNKLITIFPNIRFQQKFGTSETNAIRVKNRSKESLFMKIEDPNIEYKIINNELWLKSRTQILGYLNTENDSFEQGWFKTGDIVETADDGYFKIIGRKKEVINVGGEKVYPSEVENIILQHEKVEDCIVYGVKNLITGESVIAEVKLIINNNPDNIKREIKQLCLKSLDHYKCPSKIKIVEEININNRFKKLRNITS